MFNMKEFYQDPVTTTIAALGIAGGAQIHAIDQQKAASRDNKRAAARQRRLQAIKSARERRAQVRAGQKAQAEIIAGGVASGTTQTSSVSQGQGSVQSQLASNISFLDSVESLNKETSIFQQKAAKHGSNAATATAVGNLALTGASLFAPTPKTP
jgi:hypothetical protein